MDAHYSPVVIDERPIIGRLGFGPAALRIEQQVERRAASFVRGIHGLNFGFGRHAAIEVRLRQAVVVVDVTDGVAQLV
jgi:hypothetical protein